MENVGMDPRLSPRRLLQGGVERLAVAVDDARRQHDLLTLRRQPLIALRARVVGIRTHVVETVWSYQHACVALVRSAFDW